MRESTMKRSSVREEFDMVFEEENLEKARESLQRKIDELEDKKKLGDAHYLLGYICQRDEDYDKAYEHLREAEKLRRTVDDKEGLVETLSFLGTVEKEKGNEEKGLENLAEAAGLERELENFESAGTFYAMLANGHDELGRTDEVLHYQNKAIEMMEELDKKGESTLNVEAMIFTKKGGEELRDIHGKRIEAFKEEYEGESEVLTTFEAFDEMENSLSELREELD